MYIDMYEYYKGHRVAFKQDVISIQWLLRRLCKTADTIGFLLFNSDTEIWCNINYAQQHIDQIDDWYCSKI